MLMFFFSSGRGFSKQPISNVRIHNLPQEEVQKYAVEMLKQEEQVRQISRSCNG